MVRAAALVLALAAVACGDDGLSGTNGDLAWEGTPGTAVPAAFDGIVPTVTVTLDGASTTFLCDTGAPVTILDVDSFPAYPAGVHTVAMDAFGLAFPEVFVASWNLYPQPPGEAPDGIIGGDVLRHFAFTLDYRGWRAWLAAPFDPALTPADAAVGAWLDVPADVAGGGRGRVASGDVVTIGATRVLVEARFESMTDPVWALVDSGASYAVLDEEFLATLGDLPDRPRLDGVQVTTANGIESAYLSRVWRLEAGALASVDDLPVLVVPGTGIFDGISLEVSRPVHAIVGGSFLRRFLTTFDYPERLVRLAPYTDTSHIDPDEFIGIGAVLDAGADGVWTIVNVYPSTDAAAKGLTVGDVVEQIDGTPIAGQSSEFVASLLAAHAVGETASLGLDRGSLETVDVLIEDLLPSYPPPP